MKLGRLEEAAKVYEQLLDRNPENVDYYRRIEACNGLGNWTGVDFEREGNLRP